MDAVTWRGWVHDESGMTRAEALRALLADGHGGLTPDDDARRRVIVKFAEPDARKIRITRPTGGALWFTRRR